MKPCTHNSPCCSHWQEWPTRTRATSEPRRSARRTSYSRRLPPPPSSRPWARARPPRRPTTRNEQVSGVLGAANIQTGLNNNTVQAGQEEAAPPVLTTSRASAVDGNGGNESNGNTNTVGDQTALNGNNFQQTNTRALA
jgi:hypothetical protein